MRGHPWGALAALVTVAACSSSDSGGSAIAVTATDTECQVAATELEAGSHTFEVDNKGHVVTEVYVYGPGDKVVTEKEDIGPGTRARFKATLAPGPYEVTCKPGQRGNGIRQAISVT